MKTTLHLRLAALALPLVLSGCIAESVGNFPDQEALCEADFSREFLRAASSVAFPDPVINTIKVNGTQVWSAAMPAVVPTFKPGDKIELLGSGLGNGPDIDFTKIMLGNTRVLETDLKMYKQKLDIIKEVNYETSETHSTLFLAGPPPGSRSVSLAMPAKALSECKFRNVSAITPRSSVRESRTMLSMRKPNASPTTATSITRATWYQSSLKPRP